MSRLLFYVEMTEIGFIRHFPIDLEEMGFPLYFKLDRKFGNAFRVGDSIESGL